MPANQPFTISFDEQQATAIRVGPQQPPDRVLAALALPPCRGVIVVHGGASALEDTALAPVRAFLAEGLVPLADEHRLLVADGATQTGVARLLGEARAAAGATFPLVGVAPHRTVAYPGGPPKRQERFALNPNHSHFIFVDGGPFGVESELLVGLVRGAGVPGLALVVNGGKIVLTEVRAQAEQHNPIVIVRGSGRAADGLADSTSAERAALPPGARVYVADIRTPQAFRALALGLLGLPAP
jgi:hypothetical protein